MPVQRALHQLRDLVEHALLAGAGAEHAVEGEVVLLRWAAAGRNTYFLFTVVLAACRLAMPPRTPNHLQPLLTDKQRAMYRTRMSRNGAVPYTHLRRLPRQVARHRDDEAAAQQVPSGGEVQRHVGVVCGVRHLSGAHGAHATEDADVALEVLGIRQSRTRCGAGDRVSEVVNGHGKGRLQGTWHGFLW